MFPNCLINFSEQKHVPFWCDVIVTKQIDAGNVYDTLDIIVSYGNYNIPIVL